MEDATANSSLSYMQFLLHGFPGFSQSRYILAIPILVIFIIILMGNCSMMCIIWMERSLHSPMYILMSLLFTANVSYAVTFMPKFLVALAFGQDQITLTGCLTQMFSLYILGSYESNLLLLMALDRYVAITIPLRYHRLMSKRSLTFLAAIGLLRSFLFVSLIVAFDSNVRFCKSNVILSFACENMSLLRLGCGDISAAQAVGLWVRILLIGMDGTFVFASYLSILHTVMRLVAGKAREKAWQTCSAHLLVALVTYVFGLSSSLVYRLENVVSTDVQNLVSLLNYVLPAVADPVIYGLKMREIRNILKRKLATSSGNFNLEIWRIS